MRLSLFIIITALLLAASSGCTRKDTLVNRYYGTSYEIALQSQLANPDAGIKNPPPEGLEGNVATKVINRYEEGFEKPAPKTDTYSVSFEGMKTK